MSHVSGLIVPFISQGPKGPRGIKGAPGDRGQMGERVSVGDREGERQMCPIHHILWLPWGFCMCLGVFGWICKCFSLFQGEDGVQGNGTAGCHGFQVCVNSSSCMSCTHDTVFWTFMSFFKGYPGPRGDPGEPVSVLSDLYWTDVCSQLIYSGWT